MLENNKDQLQRGRSGEAFLSKWPFNLRPKGRGVSHLKKTSDNSTRENILWLGAQVEEKELTILMLVYTTLVGGIK